MYHMYLFFFFERHVPYAFFLNYMYHMLIAYYLLYACFKCGDPPKKDIYIYIYILMQLLCNV